ncbi:MAG: PfkB family carbohydrate kinase [Dehalococcoidia bacterium]|nr:PfkB family carbohydrate kinase [Dehalococcoidia bacterium]
MGEYPQEPILVVGPLCIDHTAKGIQLGGAVSYAASVIHSMGYKARILTIGNSNIDLGLLKKHELHIIPDPKILTFEIDNSKEERKLKLLQKPTKKITLDDLPKSWRNNNTLIVAPLIENDIDLLPFLEFSDNTKNISLLTQGLQRREQNKMIYSRINHFNSLISFFTDSFSIFRSEQEASFWSESQVEKTLATGARIITTLGKQGALIHKSNTITKIQPVLTDSELDTTGAGDIFATAFTLSLKYGERQAGNLAAAYATSSIEQIGPMPLPSQKIIRKRVLDEPRSFDHNHQGD